jgi:hypothetical protein
MSGSIQYSSSRDHKERSADGPKYHTKHGFHVHPP